LRFGAHTSFPARRKQERKKNYAEKMKLDYEGYHSFKLHKRAYRVKQRNRARAITPKRPVSSVH
jgi:hypothetical protein